MCIGKLLGGEGWGVDKTKRSDQGSSRGGVLIQVSVRARSCGGGGGQGEARAEIRLLWLGGRGVGSVVASAGESQTCLRPRASFLKRRKGLFLLKGTLFSGFPNRQPKAKCPPGSQAEEV